MLLLGGTCSGKTNFMRFLWFNKLKYMYDFGIVICGTNDLHNAYDEFVEPEYIHEIQHKDDFEPIEKLFTLCKQYKKDGRNFQSFILLDDMLGTINFKNDTFVKIIATCRHYNISVFILMQQLSYFLPSGVRENIKYYCIFKIRDRTLEKVYEYVKHKFRTKDEYLKFITSRKKYSCMLIYPDLETEDDNIILLMPPLV